MLIKILNDFKESHIPKLKKIVKNETPLFNNNIRKLMKKRDNLYKRLRRTAHSHFKIKYKKTRNKLTKIIRIVKGKYELKIIKRSKNNRKIFYAHVNSKNRKGGGKKIGPLIRSGIRRNEEILEEDIEIANMLNEQFCSVFNREDGNTSEKNAISNKSQECFLENMVISNDDVVKAISEFKVNKSPGIDKITSTYAIKIKDIVAQPLRILFNKSIDTNEIPKD